MARKQYDGPWMVVPAVLGLMLRVGLLLLLALYIKLGGKL